jgi:hypothetical protein
MKYIFSFILICLFCLGLGQSLAQVRFGLRGGFNLATASGIKGSAGVQPGFHFGGMVEIPISYTLFLQPSVLLSTKGYRYTTITQNISPPDFTPPRSSVFTNEGKINIYYAELPVLLCYKLDLGIGKLMLGAGPYAAYAWRATDQARDTYVAAGVPDLYITDVSLKYKLPLSGENQVLKPLDYGATALLGLELEEKYQISFTYQHGLANISALPNQTLQNRVFGISLGFLFGY